MAKGRTPRPLADVVEHVLDAIGQIDEFTADMDLATFQSDVRTVRAVEGCLEIISEASRDIPTAIVSEHPEINWRAIADAGNLYRHGYEHVSTSILWQTVQDDLEPLRRAVSEIAKRHLGGSV